MIQRLYVHNFRCLENFELSLPQKSSVLLLGKNGSGKSTVMAVLELLQQIARGVNRVGDLAGRGDFTQERVLVPMRFEIEAHIQGREFVYSLALELPENFRELRVLEESLKVNGSPAYTRDRASVQIGRGSSFLVDWHLVALYVLQERSVEDPLRVFRQWLSQTLLVAPQPSLMTGESKGDTLQLNRRVDNFGEWLSGLLLQAPSAYAHMIETARAAMPDLLEIANPSIGDERHSLRCRFQQDSAQLTLPFRQLSDGEKCFVLGAAIAAASHVYAPVLCFWDEPESHLSPSEVGQFVIGLRQAFRAGSQLIVTSHNLEAIARFSDENTYVFSRRSHLEPTIVRPLSQLDYKNDLADALLRDALTSP